MWDRGEVEGQEAARALQTNGASSKVWRMTDFSLRAKARKPRAFGFSIKLTLAVSWRTDLQGKTRGYCSNLGQYLAWSRGSRDGEICLKPLEKQF